MSEPVRISNSPSIFVDNNISSTNIVISGAIGSTVSAGGTVSGAVPIGGTVSSINNIQTEGLGTPAIYGYGRKIGLIGATNSVSPSPAFFLGAVDGSLWVSANINITASGSFSIQVNVIYTDEDNASNSMPLVFAIPNPANVITNLNGVGAYSSMPIHIRAKAGTTINIDTSGTFTSVTYNFESIITQLT